MICMILKLASILLANQNRTNESEIHLAKIETVFPFFILYTNSCCVFVWAWAKNKTLAVESEHLKNERNWIEWEPKITRVKSRNVYAHDLAFEWIWVESRCVSKAKIAEQREWRACALRFVVRFSFNGKRAIDNFTVSFILFQFIHISPLSHTIRTHYTVRLHISGLCMRS